MELYHASLAATSDAADSFPIFHNIYGVLVRMYIIDSHSTLDIDGDVSVGIGVTGSE